MVSLRQIAECLDVADGDSISVLRDILGFSRRRVPTDPDNTVNATVSMLQFIQEVQGDHIHLNVIRVGFDILSAATQDEYDHKIDYSVYRTRNIYRPIGIGVGRVERYFITSAQADGMDIIGSTEEANELWSSWSAPGDGVLDVFMVRNVIGFTGLSPIGGDCDKPSKRDGLLGGDIERAAAIDLDFERVARTFAHEIGHFLGLEHNHDDDCPDTAAGRRNLMAQTRCVTNNTVAANIRAAVELSQGQGNIMDDHCSIQDGC